MKSAVAITQEIDNLEFAAKELISQIKDKLDFGKNSIGIIYCDADVDVASLGELLKGSLGMDIVGLTTTATIERNNGYNDMGILLSVMTGDDVEFSVGSTGDLSNDSFPAAIKEAYKKARANTQNDPKLILTFAPYIADLTSENYVELLDEASGGIPVFGGVATDHYDLQYQKTFFNGQAFARGLVFLLLSGDIKPVFAMNHHFGTKVEKKGMITKSTGNLVQRVGDQTFKEYVSSIVPVPDEELVIYHFQSTPFVMELPDFEKDEQPVVRALVTVDHENGAGSFLSKMPEGSMIYLNEFQRNELRESCKEALSNITKRMDENKGYKYSMMFISTCNARHLLMADAKNLESDILSEYLGPFPAELNAMGFYGFGEICPTGKRADGTAKNRFHNISFAVCAI
ncbi:MAG: FIST C-terminal domain-containing protein [Defluviitaleaceae bacterium]|nr:FIST C-terminal domain-containing protein [Defluviitaleaceae bacterium]